MSFKDTLEKTRETLRESNRSNLAHAFLRVEEREEELREQLGKFAALKTEIELAGDESALIDQNSATRVRELHNRSMKDWL